MESEEAESTRQGTHLSRSLLIICFRIRNRRRRHRRRCRRRRRRRRRFTLLGLSSAEEESISLQRFHSYKWFLSLNPNLTSGIAKTSHLSCSEGVSRKILFTF